MSLTPVANEINLQSEKLKLFSWVLDKYIFFFKFTLRCQQSESVPLPTLSTTPAVLVAKFAAGVIDTGGKFATVVVDTGGAPLLANISTNFRKKSK